MGGGGRLIILSISSEQLPYTPSNKWGQIFSAILRIFTLFLLGLESGFKSLDFNRFWLVFTV